MPFLHVGRTFQPAQVSEHEKGLYMQQFDQLWRFVQEVEKKLIMYHALFGDEPSTTKLVTIVRHCSVLPLVPFVYLFLDRNN